MTQREKRMAKLASRVGGIETPDDAMQLRRQLSGLEWLLVQLEGR